MADIKVTGSAIGIVKKTAQALKDKKRFLNRATAYQERSTKMNFAQQSSPDGQKWAPLSASTLRYKRSGAILRETSALINSISSRVDADKGEVFATQSYGVFHQLGTRKMPKRQFLGFGAKDIERINNIAREEFGFD